MDRHVRPRRRMEHRFRKGRLCAQEDQHQHPGSLQNPPVKSVLHKVEGLVITDELKAALNEGNKLFDEKKYQEAIAATRRSWTQNPDVYIVYKNIGNCWFELQDYDKAEEAYKKVLDKEPTNSEIMLLIGNCYANRDETDKAMEWYSKIEFEKITDPTVLFNIGIAYTKPVQVRGRPEISTRGRSSSRRFPRRNLPARLDLSRPGQESRGHRRTSKATSTMTPTPDRATQVKGFLDFLKKK